MIQIKFDPANLSPERKAKWDAWIAKAAAAQKGVIAQWENWKKNVWNPWKTNPTDEIPQFQPKWDDSVWKDLRDLLLEHVFHYKCAYCENPKAGFPGDAEHFRPKGRVRIRSDEKAEFVTIVDENGDEIRHPGYFWLAYNWKNLLPACETCNRAGKKDFFPVDNEHVGVRRLTLDEIDTLIEKITRSDADESIFYLEPTDLDVMERPLLLHPYYDDPKAHIYFQRDGMAKELPGSERGRVSIDIYRLNDDDTKRVRNRAQVDGTKLYSDRVMAAMPDATKMKVAASEVIDEYYKGERPYAAAVFDYIHDFFDSSAVDPEILLK